MHAVVVPEQGHTVSASDVVEYCRGRLAGFKVPKSVEIRAQPLPMSAAMKPLKRRLGSGTRPGRSPQADAPPTTPRRVRSA